MEPHTIERAAMLMREKYGDDALPKSVSAAMYYAEMNDDAGSNRWIQIGYAIKALQEKEWATRKTKSKQKEPA